MLVFDKVARDPNALVETDEMRAGESVDAVTSGLERGSNERHGRSLAVGASDVKHWRKSVLRTPEPVEQRLDAFQAEPVAWGRQGRKAVELGLDARMCRAREIGH